MSTRTGVLAVAALAVLMMFGPWPLVISAALVGVGWLINERDKARDRHRIAALAEHDRLAAQMAQQHAWVCQGDPRGIYGEATQ